MSDEEWLSANQRLLVAEFTRLKARLADKDSAAAEVELSAAQAAMPASAAIDVVANVFGLSSFERDVLLLCAGVEMDAALAAQCAELNGMTRTPGATMALALAGLANPHWSALTPVRPLRLWRLVEARDERALTTSRLAIDERVLHYLAGINYLDPRVRSIVREHSTRGLLAASHAAEVEAASRMLERAEGAKPVIQLHGEDAAGQIESARCIAERSGNRLHVIVDSDIPANAHEAEALALLWYRESLLLQSALLVKATQADTQPIARFVERLDGMVFIASPQPVRLNRENRSFQVDRPAAIEQRQLWSLALAESATELNGSLDAISAQFRLDTDSIVRTAQDLRTSDNTGAGVEETLWRACRDIVRGRLDELAQRVVPAATWVDLVLPEPQRATLRQVVSHVRHRLKVYEQWGFADKCARGLGVSVLFTGESGTGKTMAAEVLANELRLDLYRIDLASMVSKYVGETEKNLRQVFDAAEDSGAILLFDEADALFGKRSEVKDSHDRYANIEVSYLLQRMEAYRGLAILTTNLKGSLDTAFQRRLRFIVAFPFPDLAMRERIWRGVFPPGAPLDGIDHTRLAQLNVAGGSIRNIAMNAAFIAADAHKPLCMGDLLQAARSEAAKRERPFSDAETRGWQ